MPNLEYMNLIEAAEAGDIELVKSLLDQGADVNYQDEKGWTPLVQAAEAGQAEVLNLLLDRGGDIEQQAINKALDKAAYEGHKEIVKMLLHKALGINDAEALQYAAQCGDIELVKSLLDQGVDVNYQDKIGRTALTFATESDNKVMVKLLLAKGANINIATYKGWTPLIFAAADGYEELVEFLLNNGANPSLQRSGGWTALQMASSYSVIKQFIIAGAFTLDYITEIKEHAKEILDASSHAEKVTVLANLIATASQADQEFIQGTIKLLNAEISEINTIIDTKNFRVREKIKLCEKLQILKAKTKVIDLTQEVLERLWNKTDDKLIAELKVSYNKISEISGRYISKEKLDKNPTQKIMSYFENDDDLENVCLAVPYQYALKVLKPSLSQQDVAVDAQTTGAEDNAAVLGAEEVTKDISTLHI